MLPLIWIGAMLGCSTFGVPQDPVQDTPTDAETDTTIPEDTAVTEPTDAEPTAPTYTFEDGAIASLRDDRDLLGTQVTVIGLVTALAPEGFFIQDGTDARSGMYIYMDDADTVNGLNGETWSQALTPGDVVKVQGVFDAFSLSGDNTGAQDEVSPVDGGKVELLGFSNPVEAASVWQSALLLNGDDYEAMLVTVVNAVCETSAPGQGYWTTEEGLKIGDLMHTTVPQTGDSYDEVTGIYFYRDEEYRLMPRQGSDLR